jgi:two-component system, response regulator YesN
MNGKLLLVEDQVFFRKGLRKMIEDHSLGWTVVGEAENGKEALELMDRLKPNLVLTDIRMPGMDGLELAEQLQQRELKPDVVILTGYDDFKYAQAAIRFGVIDFLLKPCNEEALMDVLEKAYGRLLAVNKRLVERDTDLRLRAESLLRALLLRLPGLSGGEELLLRRVLHKRLVLIGVDDFFPARKPYREADLGLLQFAVYNIANELLGETGAEPGSVVPLEFDHFCFLAGGEKEADELGRSIKDSVFRYLGITVTVFVSPEVGSLNDPPSYYERFLRTGKASPFGTGSAHKQSLQGGPGNQARSKELQTRLTGAVLLGQADKLAGMTGEMTACVAVLPLEDAKMEALALAFAMHAVGVQQFEEEGNPAGFGKHIEYLQTLQTPDSVGQWARETGDRFLQAYSAWRNGKNENIISRTLEYLDSHYMDTCSLTELSSMFHISSTYFSKLFKKETGDNFSAYLTKLRMQKAGLLLLNTDMKVFEIAAAIGYDDPNYFTNVFRMLLGMSPSDYRKQHKGS